MSTSTYPHPLDYVTGLKYTLTRDKIPLEFEINPQVFHVEEVVDLHGLGFNKEHGEYAVLEMSKRGIEMFRALDYVTRELNIPSSNIYFYGIKDREATTTSYLFIKTSILHRHNLPIKTRNLSVDLVGFIRRKPTREFFEGNRFTVIMEPRSEDYEHLVKKIIGIMEKHGLPSYYGYQRFGWKRYNSHILGKYIVLGREDLFSRQLLKTMYPREDPEASYKRILGIYTGMLFESRYVAKPMGKRSRGIISFIRDIYIDAYASYLYNLVLNSIIEKKGIEHLDMSIPMPGCTGSRGLYEDIFTLEGIDSSSVKYMPCFQRHGLFKPLFISISRTSEGLVLEFLLKPGMYATIVLRELFKDNLLI